MLTDGLDAPETVPLIQYQWQYVAAVLTYLDSKRTVSDRLRLTKASAEFTRTNKNVIKAQKKSLKRIQNFIKKQPLDLSSGSAKNAFHTLKEWVHQVKTIHQHHRPYYNAYVKKTKEHEVAAPDNPTTYHWPKVFDDLLYYYPSPAKVVYAPPFDMGVNQIPRQ